MPLKYVQISFFYSCKYWTFRHRTFLDQTKTIIFCSFDVPKRFAQASSLNLLKCSSTAYIAKLSYHPNAFRVVVQWQHHFTVRGNFCLYVWVISFCISQELVIILTLHLAYGNTECDADYMHCFWEYCKLHCCGPSNQSACSKWTCVPNCHMLQTCAMTDTLTTLKAAIPGDKQLPIFKQARITKMAMCQTGTVYDYFFLNWRESTGLKYIVLKITSMHSIITGYNIKQFLYIVLHVMTNESSNQCSSQVRNMI